MHGLHSFALPPHHERWTVPGLAVKGHFLQSETQHVQKKIFAKSHSLKASLVPYKIALASESIKFYVLMLFARLTHGMYIDDVTRKAKQYIFFKRHTTFNWPLRLCRTWLVGTGYFLTRPSRHSSTGTPSSVMLVFRRLSSTMPASVSTSTSSSAGNFSVGDDSLAPTRWRGPCILMTALATKYGNFNVKIIKWRHVCLLAHRYGIYVTFHIKFKG